MLILPVAEQSEHKRFPIVTVGLIMLNTLAYILGFVLPPDLISSLYFVPAHPTVLTVFTSMFLHAGADHLVGNMWFLWLVGRNIEDALTPLGALALYLGAGCFAVFAHSHLIGPDMMDIPLLGASGAIAGLMGATAVIFPLKKIRFFYWVFFAPILFLVCAFAGHLVGALLPNFLGLIIGVIVALWLLVKFWPLMIWSGFFEADAVWCIGLWFGQQLMLQYFDHNGGIAYGAHIGGFCISAVLAMILVRCRLVTPHWRRDAGEASTPVVAGYRNWEPEHKYPTQAEARRKWEERQKKLDKQKPELPPMKW